MYTPLEVVHDLFGFMRRCRCGFDCNVSCEFNLDGSTRVHICNSDTKRRQKIFKVPTETESINSGEKQDEFQQIKGDKKHTSLLLHDDEAQSQHGNGVCTDYIRRNAIALKSGHLSRDQPFCLCFLPTSLRCSGVVPFRILP